MLDINVENLDLRRKNMKGKGSSSMSIDQVVSDISISQSLLKATIMYKEECGADHDLDNLLFALEYQLEATKKHICKLIQEQNEEYMADLKKRSA
ncbi:MAG: hypothetical protein ACK5M5_03205 [Limnobaculum xujianqingii]